MIRYKPHIVSGILMLIVMSISLTFSTLHSHHHIQWDHPQDFVDTGNCITADTTICPICGYHLKASFPDSPEIESFTGVHTCLVSGSDLIIPEFPAGITTGRSPPAAA